MTNMKNDCGMRVVSCEGAGPTVHAGSVLLTIEAMREGDTTAPRLTPNPMSQAGV